MERYHLCTLLHKLAHKECFSSPVIVRRQISQLPWWLALLFHLQQGSHSMKICISEIFHDLARFCTTFGDKKIKFQKTMNWSSNVVRNEDFSRSFLKRIANRYYEKGFTREFHLVWTSQTASLVESQFWRELLRYCCSFLVCELLFQQLMDLC